MHADIKGSNILLSTKEKNQVYLVDFGLATHFNTDKTFKPNPKKAHNGTIEYLSRDAHLGGKHFFCVIFTIFNFHFFFLVETRRGDLEILAYNLIHWLGGKLPWENKLTDPKLVQQSKEEHMADIKNFLKTCFDGNPPSRAIENYIKYVNDLKFDEEPDYKKLTSILLTGLKEAGGAVGKPLMFGNKKTPEKRKGLPPTTPPKRTKKTTKKEEKTNSSTEENKTPVVVKKRVNKKKEETVENGENNGYEGYTPAMLEIVAKKQKKTGARARKEPAASTSKGITETKRTLRLQQPVNYFPPSDDDKTPAKIKTTTKRRT